MASILRASMAVVALSGQVAWTAAEQACAADVGGCATAVDSSSLLQSKKSMGQTAMSTSEENQDGTPDADKLAQEVALMGKCDLAKIAQETKMAVKNKDTNKDGKLSSEELQTEGGTTGDVPLNEMLVAILEQVLGPSSDQICNRIQDQKSALGESLCKELKGVASNLTDGGAVSAEELGRCAAKVKTESEPDEPSAEGLAIQKAHELQVAQEAQEEHEDQGDLAFLEVTSKYNASVFAKMKKGQKKVGGEVAWASVMKSINKLFVSDYCFKDVWWRGMAGRICKSGWYQSGLLCYQHCRSGYGRFGDHCWQHCPSNFNDIGTYCQREYWDDCCTNTWFGRACIRCPKIETRGKDIYYSQSCILTSGTCTSCPSDHYAWGASCYRNAKPGYRCSGGELTCHRDCTAPIGTDCAAGCALDVDSCLSNTATMVMGVVESAISIATLAMTFGASAGATAMTAATKASLLQAAKRMSLKNAVRVAKQKFKDELKAGYKRVISKAMKKMKDQVAESVRGKIEEKQWELIMAYSASESETIAEHYMAKTKAEGKNPALIVVKDIDPTGIASAIDSSVAGEDSANKQAAGWLDVFSMADPTGVLGAVSNFIKNDHCEHTIAKMNEIEDKGSFPPSLKDWGCKKYTGWISGGDNVAIEWMQPKDAYAYCANNDACKGFTMSGSPSDASYTSIWFKSKWDYYGSGWTSYKCD
jgi:hypothetical protein